MAFWYADPVFEACCGMSFSILLFSLSLSSFITSLPIDWALWRVLLALRSFKCFGIFYFPYPYVDYYLSPNLDYVELAGDKSPNSLGISVFYILILILFWRLGEVFDKLSWSSSKILSSSSSFISSNVFFVLLL